jgi:hypothetical protein
MTYSCATCGSTRDVRHNHTTYSLERPLLDERGKVITKTERDKRGVSRTVEVMEKYSARSLGTWRCHSTTCRGDKAKVKARISE